MSQCEHCGRELQPSDERATLRFNEGPREGEEIEVCMSCLHELYGPSIKGQEKKP